MGKYIVTSGQNLYDIALHIYGSIEGIVDLMMHNEDLSLSEKLRVGQELSYTDNYVIDASIVAYNMTNSIVPANGERNVYYKESEFSRLLDFDLKNEITSTNIKVSGQGTIDIDWGDNTLLETIELTNNVKIITHTFDNKIPDNREIRIYGDSVLFRILDLTDLRPIGIFVYKRLIVEKIELQNNSANLNFLQLIDETFELDFSGSTISSLLPLIYTKDLLKLNLKNCRISTEELDNYLISLVENYNERRNCFITLTHKPSGEYKEPFRDENNRYILSSGMEAIYVLLHEPAWNEGGGWKFIINDQTYTNI